MPASPGSPVRALAGKIGARLDLARRRKGLSQRRLAILADVDPSFVNHLIAGRRLPSLVQLWRFGAVLAVDPKDLLP